MCAYHRDRMSEQHFQQTVRPRRTTQPPVYLRDYEVQYPMQHSPVPEELSQQRVRTYQSEILPPDSPLSSSHDYSTGAAGATITPYSRMTAGRQPDRRWPTAPHYESDEEEEQEDETSLTAVRHRLEVQEQEVLKTREQATA